MRHSVIGSASGVSFSVHPVGGNDGCTKGGSVVLNWVT